MAVTPEMLPVAWLRKNGFRFNGDIEPQDDSELPLYLRPALTDEQVREIAERHAAEFKKRTEIEIGAAWFIDAIREAIGRGERG
ncbi:MAG: hypothetical protein WA154_10965 [Moraxellaceae bacterium]